MGRIETEVARDVKAVTRVDVMRKAVEGTITWSQAAEVLRVTPRHMLRLRWVYEQFGVPGLRDRRTGRRMPTRLDPALVEELCRLRRERYADFSIRHFHQFATEKHGLHISYTWTRKVLQMTGLAEQAPGRGKYRRKRERRPMVGMMVHLDASTHAWLPGRPMQDLVVALDDAGGRILYARFLPQEGVYSTLCALRHVLTRYGRFCELYTDRGSHFCRTTQAADGPDAEQDGQVSRVLKALGIRQILARSPEARGRSERCFGTIQGRLPQELRLHEITSYDAANSSSLLETPSARHRLRRHRPRRRLRRLVEALAFVGSRLLRRERLRREHGHGAERRIVEALPSSPSSLHRLRRTPPRRPAASWGAAVIAEEGIAVNLYVIGAGPATTAAEWRR
jgi:hypothetical protein